MPRSKSHRKPTAQEVREQELYGALKELLEQLGWTVTLARHLDGRGGHCLVRGEKRVIASARFPWAERVELLVEALRGEELDDVFVRPDLRELIEGAGAASG